MANPTPDPTSSGYEPAHPDTNAIAQRLHDAQARAPRGHRLRQALLWDKTGGLAPADLGGQGSVSRAEARQGRKELRAVGLPVITILAAGILAWGYVHTNAQEAALARFVSEPVDTQDLLLVDWEHNHASVRIPLPDPDAPPPSASSKPSLPQPLVTVIGPVPDAPSAPITFTLKPPYIAKTASFSHAYVVRQVQDLWDVILASTLIVWFLGAMIISMPRHGHR